MKNIMVAVVAQTKITSARRLYLLDTGIYFCRNIVILTLVLTKNAPNKPPRQPMHAKMGTSQKYHQYTRL